jgi:hypothetical protein
MLSTRARNSWLWVATRQQVPRPASQRTASNTARAQSASWWPVGSSASSSGGGGWSTCLTASARQRRPERVERPVAGGQVLVDAGDAGADPRFGADGDGLAGTRLQGRGHRLRHPHAVGGRLPLGGGEPPDVAGEAVPGRELHRRRAPTHGERDRRAEQGADGVAEPRRPAVHDPLDLAGEPGQLVRPERRVHEHRQRRDAADLAQVLLEGGVAGGGQEQPRRHGDGDEDQGGAGDGQRDPGKWISRNGVLRSIPPVGRP